MPASPANSRYDGPALLPLAHHSGKPAIPLHRPVTVVGSRSTARIHLMSSTVSKAHALIVHSNGRTYIRDLASRTHIYVNGKQIRDVELAEGDLIKLGSFTFKFVQGRKRATAPPQAAPPAELAVTGADFPIPMDQRVLLIGRRPSVDIPLIEESASTAHAVIFEMNGDRYVRDLGSRTGTFVNGVSTHQHKLTPGDTLRVGDTDIRYHLSTEAPRIDIPTAGESAAGYALEAPTEEFAPEPAAPGVEHDTMGGLDLLGEVVKSVTEPAVEPEVHVQAALPIEPPLPIEEPTAIEEPQAPQVPPVAPEIPAPEAAASPATEAPAEDELDAEDLLGPDIEPAPQVAPEIAPAAPEVASAEVAPISPASTDIVDAPIELSGAPQTPAENLSGADPAAETTPADDPDAKLHPRRGWRATGPPAPAGEPEKRTEEVLRFDDQRETADFSAGDDQGGTAVLDHAAFAPPDDTVPPLELDLGLSLDSEAGAPTEPLRFEIDLSEPPPEAPPPPLDLHLAIEPASESLPPPEIPDAPSTAEPAEHETPLVDLPAMEEPADLAAPAKKTRARKPRAKKPKKAAHEEVLETPAGVVEPLPEAPEITPAEATSTPEVLEHTEPTPESALDLHEVTPEPALDEAAIADVLGDAPESDALTDSVFTRAVEELTSGGTTGEIIEEPPVAAANIAEPGVPVIDELPPPQQQDVLAEAEPALAGASAIEPPLPELAPAESEVDHFESMIEMELPAVEEAQSILPDPSQTVAPLELEGLEESPAGDAAGVDEFQVGANQENFLGGIPLPRPKLPPRRGQAAQPAAGGDAVDDLIREIDSAAAAAERAGSADPNSPWVPVPPPAIRPRRPRSPFRKDELAAGPAIPPPARPLDESIPPYRSDDASKSGSINLGFDGLAMPPVREMDVFAQMSPAAPAGSEDASESDDSSHAQDDVMTPMDLVGADAGTSDGTPRPPARPRSRATPGHESVEAGDLSGMGFEAPPDERRVQPAFPAAPDAAARNPAVMYAAEESEIDAAAQRRRQLRRVPVLFGGMLASLAAAVAGIYFLVPPRTTIEATLSFRNLETRAKRDRDQFQEQQRRVLLADTTRRDARARLARIDSAAAPGFLDEQLDYLKVVDRATWPESRRNSLVIPMQGAPADANRLRALLLTVFDANKRYLDDAERARHSLRSIQDDIARYDRRLNELKGEKEALRIKGEQAPTPQQLKHLESETSRLLEEWNHAIAAVKNTEAELTRMRQQPGTGAAAGQSGADAPVDDEELAKMQKELDVLTAKADLARESSSERADAARRALDEAMASFQTEIAAASQLNQGNPELTAYVASAQKLQETTRNLIDDLFKKQERQFGQLMELKERLNDKLESRRSEMWMADQELQQLTERLAILTRQYNAAVGGGLQKEASDLQSQIELTKNLVKARQDLIPGDAFYADAVQQLQLIIDNTKKNIDADRIKTDQLVEQLQRSFTSSPPPTDKLPAAQRDLSKQLEKKLAAINDARKQYNAAIDVGAADLDPALKQQITTLTAGVEARRKQLADAAAQQLQGKMEQDRAANITVREVELEELKKAEHAAEKAYLARNKDLRDMQLVSADSKSNSEKLDEVINQQGIVEVQLKTLNDQLEAKQRDASSAIEPIKPTEHDVVAREGDDRRPLYAGVSSLAILVLFGSLILLAWQAASRDASYGALAASDLHPGASGPHPPSANGNGSIAEKSHSENEPDHHAPAIV